MNNQLHYFTFTFVDENRFPVGWNSVIARNMDEAKAEAKVKWDGTGLTVDYNSFQKQSDEEMEQLMVLSS